MLQLFKVFKKGVAMLKNIFIIFVLVFTTLVYSAGNFDKNIIIHNQTRDDKVKSVFKKLMSYYEDEDEDGFFSLVSEDRFLQDFMLFEQAIEKDFRTYEILDFEYWIDKITSDGVKRYLYVKWEKRYELVSSTNELTQRGYSRFLFDEINGKYKLIELAGNNLWGNSLNEWKKEVPHVTGEEKVQKDKDKQKEEEQGDDQGGDQDVESTGSPDLVIEQTCQEDGYFKIKNIGTASTNTEYIEYAKISSEYSPTADEQIETYRGALAPEESSEELNCGSVGIYGGIIIVDPNNQIDESNEDNNKASINIEEYELSRPKQ